MLKIFYKAFIEILSKRNGEFLGQYGWYVKLRQEQADITPDTWIEINYI